MASAITINCSLAASPIRASSGSGRKPEPNRRKASSSTWWAPLFGWSSDPDYVDTISGGSASIDRSDTLESESNTSGRPKSRFTLGCFTEEKARQLRKKTVEGSSFHDIMYHSAIASRLASDTSDPSYK